jgi:hypothetical protein
MSPSLAELPLTPPVEVPTLRIFGLLQRRRKFMVFLI